MPRSTTSASCVQERLALMRRGRNALLEEDELIAEIRELRDPEPVFAAERRKNAALEAKLREATLLEAKPARARRRRRSAPCATRSNYRVLPGTRRGATTFAPLR